MKLGHSSDSNYSNISVNVFIYQVYRVANHLDIHLGCLIYYLSIIIIIIPSKITLDVIDVIVLQI